MLPSFPKIFAQRERLNRDVIHALVMQKAPLLQGIASHAVHEGAHADMVRTDGTTDRTKIHSLSGEVTLTKKRRSNFSDKEVLEALEEIAEQFAEGMSKSVIEAVSEGAEKVGNVVDGGGRPLTPDLLLEAIEQIQLDFRSDGSFEAPTMIVSPQQAEKLAAFAGSPQAEEHKLKLRKILEKKRSEFLIREAGRVLAG